ncbi:DUF5810 domain-containing protein [Haloarchaeobius sp. HME9146]|uniref:DUF5810 domain-containing protein n=1 Tax=Haloarchaeobius sp. HME9146 TaxID=2978732 RepID=UPI0021C12C7B|nr:DUF5810 domain-containing protein [Haloarchaeobius sp. HME9146]MCT9095468.1 DUF5810 domain-containing protein [Haloarchaeobius sp. HME9146]
MGYACPVCEVPHADAEHLANHLAFTAMLHSDEHEDWLDDHAPDWESSNPAELGPVVTEHVEEAEFDGVFDDTTHQHDHDHGHERFEDAVAEQVGRGAGGRGDLTSDQADVLEEARELTRQMHESDDGDENDDEDDSADTENE